MRQKSPRFHSEAAEETQAAFQWYQERNPMAAAAFLDELDHAVEQVLEAPQRWPRYGHAARRYAILGLRPYGASAADVHGRTNAAKYKDVQERRAPLFRIALGDAGRTRFSS